MSKYKVVPEKCIGCGVCVVTSDGGTELEDDGKAKVTDNAKVETAGGETVCPYGAIEKAE